jgi:hypothetical protein
MNKISLVFALSLSLTPSLSSAEQAPSDKPDFSRLRGGRLALVSEIDSTKAEIRKLEESVMRLPPSAVLEDYAKRDAGGLEYSRSQLEQLKTKKGDPDRIARLEDEVRRRQDDLSSTTRDIERRKSADRDIERLRGTLKTKEKELFDVESQISEALARDVVAQNFKSQISLYFAILVGFMILCFFGVAFYDDKVRVTIFSGQAGMQFVTLFSLIIAIILFGITGILGDKELSALLGGLSGYILGRYTQQPDAHLPGEPQQQGG